MLKVISIQQSKNAWNTTTNGVVQHIVNAVYAEIADADISDELSVLQGASMSAPTRYKDGFNLDELGKGLFVTEKDSSGNDVKTSLFAKHTDSQGITNWGSLLTDVNARLCGVVDTNAHGGNISAAELIGDESVIAVIPKSGIEIPTIPFVWRGKDGDTAAYDKAVERQRARWKQRINKGLATLKRAAVQS